MIGTFFTINASDTDLMLSYVEDFMTDLTPLLTPIIAVGIGILIFWAITKVLRP